MKQSGSPRPPSILRSPWLLAPALCAAVAGAALADGVDLELQGRDRVQGTLRPAWENELFLCRLPRGAAVKASIKARGKGAPLPTLGLVDEASQEVALGQTRGRGQKLLAPELPEQGYRLVVKGDGDLDGDYDLKVAFRYRTSWTGQGGPVEPEAEDEWLFAAPAGARVTKVAIAGDGSLVPELIELAGPDGFQLPLPGGTSAKGLLLGPAGDYRVRFRNAGAAAGSWTASLKLRAPKAPAARFDLRDAALTGSYQGDQGVYGRVVGPAGGVVDPDDDGGGLDGASVQIPADAIDYPAVITVAESQVFHVDDGVHAAGPAIAFGPPGTQFAKDVTITIPFDPDVYGDPASEMTIWVLDTLSGELAPVEKPYDFTGAPGTVSFSSSHFSAYMATSQGPRPLKGDFVGLHLSHSHDFSFTGTATTAIEDWFFGTDGSYFLYGTGTSVNYVPDNDGTGPEVFSYPAFLYDSGQHTVVDDDLVTLSGQSQQGGVTLRRGLSSDVLLREVSPQDGRPLVNVLFRRFDGILTRNNLAGDWHAFVLEVGAHAGGTALDLQVGGMRGTATFGRDGSFRLDVEEHEAQALLPGGTWSSLRGKGRLEGDFTLVEGQLEVTADEPGREPEPGERAVRFRPVLDGTVLLAQFESEGQIPRAGGSGEAAALVLVRKWAKAPASALSGPALFTGLELVAADRSGSESGIDASVLGCEMQHDGAGRLGFQGNLVGYSQDAFGDPTTSGFPVEASGVPYALARDGSFREHAPLLAGALGPGGAFRIHFAADGTRFGLGFGIPVVAPPPPLVERVR